MKKRLFALFLALCMAVALLPVSVMAEDELIPPSSGGELTPSDDCTCESEGHTWENGVCTCCKITCEHEKGGESAWAEEEDGAYKCDICGLVCDHSGNAWTRDSCLDELYCSVCGANLGALDGHDWSNHDGTCARCPMNCDHCDEIGDTWSKGFCTICGVEHDHWEWTDGVCESCGYECPHKEYNEDGTCAVCGKMKEQEPEPEPKPEPEPHEHSYTAAVTTEATCTTTGVRTYTCSCGDGYTETIPAHGHSTTSHTTKAATCVAAGECVYTCRYCDYTRTGATPASGHSYYFSARTEATCGAAGTLTYTCEKCGYSYTMETAPATGEHDYVDYSEAGGILGKRCTVCGKIVSHGELLIDETKKKKLSQTEVGWADSGENGDIIEIEQSESDSTITEGITIKSPEEAIDGLLYKITDDQTGEVTESVTIQTGSDDVHELTFGRETDDEGGGASYRVEEDGETIAVQEVNVSKKDGVITYEFTSDEGTEVTIEKGESEPLAIGTDENGSAVLQARTLEIDDAVPVDSGIVLWVNEDNEVLEYSFGERSEQTEQTESYNGSEGVRLDEYMEQTGAIDLIIGRTLSDVKFDTGIDGSLVFVGDIVLEDWQPSDSAEEQPEPTPTPTPTPEPEEEGSVTYVEIVFTTKDITPEEDEKESDESEEGAEGDSYTIEERKDNSDITYIVPFVQPEEAKEFGREAPDKDELCEVCHKYLPYNDEGICKNCLETRVLCSVCETEYVYEADSAYYESGVCWRCNRNGSYRCKECGKLCQAQGDTTGAASSWEKEGYCESCWKKSCVPTGTMITLADGTQKPVETVTEDDLLLVYDHEAGTFTTATINFIERNDAALSTVVTLAFSDGSETALVYEHGYFDLDAMRYVFLTAENAEDYIGHRFYKAEIVDGVYTPVEVELVAVAVAEEVVASYDFPTKYHLNFFADGFLSMPAETAGLTNFFAYDENLAYNAESMTAAIQAYGLLEYADLAAWLTPEEFVSYPAQYLAVNYGNGTLTEDALIELIETYVHEYR